MTSRRTSTRKAPSRASETPWFPIAVLGLFAVGCAAEARRRGSEEASPLPPKLRTLRFQVDDDSELHEDARIAARTWSKATGLDVTATPDGDTPILLVETLSESCSTEGHPNARGCAHVDEDPSGGWIEVLSSVHPNYRYGVVLHEMGHHLRGLGDHLSGIPHAVMASDRGITDTEPLPEDVAFVCAGGRVACSTPTP